MLIVSFCLHLILSVQPSREVTYKGKMENGNSSGVLTVVTMRRSAFHSDRSVPTFQSDFSS